MAQRSTTARVEAAVRAVLPRSARFRLGKSDSKSTFSINGSVIPYKWLGEGGLRHVHTLLMERPRPAVAIARRLSQGAREALSAAGVGWIDEAGAAEIVMDSLIVSRTGRVDGPRLKDNRWTPAVLAVAEALLCGSYTTVEATQRVTALSTGACTSALRVLSDLGLISSNARRGRASARRIADRDELLEAYAAAVETMRPRLPTLRLGVTWADMTVGLETAGEKWKRAGVAWAATGVVAASVIAPYLSAVTTAEVYVDAETTAGLDLAAREIDLSPIDAGRLILRPFPSTTTKHLRQEKEGICVAPWPRVYADLRITGVRGEEAAEHLRSVIHGR